MSRQYIGCPDRGDSGGHVVNVEVMVVANLTTLGGIAPGSAEIYNEDIDSRAYAECECGWSGFYSELFASE